MSYLNILSILFFREIHQLIVEKILDLRGGSVESPVLDFFLNKMFFYTFPKNKATLSDSLKGRIVFIIMVDHHDRQDYEDDPHHHHDYEDGDGNDDDQTAGVRLRIGSALAQQVTKLGSTTKASSSSPSSSS